MSTLQPLRVMARPRAGIDCVDGVLMLDSVLAYQVRWQRLGMAAMALRSDGPVEEETDLPLERRGHGDDWHWAASQAEVQWLARDVMHLNKRWDVAHDHLVDFGGRAAKVDLGAGPFKSYHKPAYLLIAETLTWYVVGDANRIAALLADVGAIGKNAARGLGALVGPPFWQIEPWPHDWSCWRDGIPMRPLPLSGGAQPSDRTIVTTCGIRAPYWHPQQRRLCVTVPVQLPSAAVAV